MTFISDFENLNFHIKILIEKWATSNIAVANERVQTVHIFIFKTTILIHLLLLSKYPFIRIKSSSSVQGSLYFKMTN